MKNTSVAATTSTINSKDWSYGEQYIMNGFYSIEGPDIAKRLNKTKSQVKRYASKRGLKYNNPNKKTTSKRTPVTRSRWTKQDDEILAKNYPTCEVEDIRKMLSGTHTVCAIRQRANKNGIYKEGRRRPKAWTFEEFVIVSAFYPTEGKKVVSRLKNRTVSDVMQYAARNGIKSKAFRGTHITDAELKIFIEFKDKGAKYCAGLTGRSLTTIYKWFKAIDKMEPSNTATTWNDADMAYLTTNYTIESTPTIAKKLNRTQKAIRNKASAMGLKKSIV